MRFSKSIENDNSNDFVAMFRNRLDDCRTYSYHHIWALTKNTDLASEIFDDEIKVKEIVNNNTHKKPGGFRTPIQPGVFIVTNGAQDSDLSIDRLQLEAIAQPPALSPGSNTLASIEGEMLLIEPQGVRFLNIYRQILQELGSLNHDVCNILKTVFIGYHKDTNQLVEIYDVPPIFFMIQDISIAASTEGSSYVIKFLHLMSVPATKALATNATGILIPNSGTIKESLNSIADQYTKAAQKNSEKQKVATNPATYRIILDKSMQEVENWSVIEERLSRTAGHENKNPIPIQADLTIDYCIQRVFKACKQYMAQAITRKRDSFMYKVVPITRRTDGNFEVVYIVVKDPIGLRYDADKRMKQKMKQSNNREISEIIEADDKVLIYDYIFTGRNTDIERFDMKIDEGLAFLNSISIFDNFSGNVNKDLQQQYPKPAAESAVLCKDDKIPEGTCSGPGRPSENVVEKNHGTAVLASEYDEIAKEQFRLEAMKMGAILNIRGNPGYISCFAVNPKKMYNGALAGTGHVTIIDDLPLVYINIMMPMYFSGDEKGNRYEPEFERFWYQGLWKILTIKSIFDGGRYTNELIMLATPTFPEADNNKSPVNSASATSNENKTTESNSEETGKFVAEQSGEQKPPKPSQTTTQQSNVAPATTPDKPVTKPKPQTVESVNNGKHLMGVVTPDTQITPNFKYGDMLRTAHADWKAGGNNPPSQKIVDNIVNTLEQLQKVRDKLGVPINITSGYRSPSVNRAAGSTASKSDHLVGCAIDFNAHNYMTPAQLVNQIRSMGIPFKQLILETPPSGSKGWVHLAFSPEPGGNHGDVRQWTGGRSYKKI